MASVHEACGSRGALAAESELVARVGERLFAAGGNAFDAAAAACLACSMVHPDKCGVGGYLLAGVVVEGATGRVWSLDANSRAPAAARAGMYEIRPARASPRAAGAGLNEREYACSVRDDANVHGPLAVGVPGQLAGIGVLNERWGRLPWAQIVQPSLDLLDDGVPVAASLAASVRGLEAVIRRFPAAAAHLLPGGRLPAAGQVWHRPGMRRTLERLAAAGWRDFYQGELAAAMARAVQAAGGLLTAADLSAFEAGIDTPHRVSYRGVEVHGAVLPNGPLSVLQALLMLDRFPSRSAADPLWWHRMTEVLKRVWRDRLTYLGDPEYGQVPVERLLDPAYARGRVEDLLQDEGRIDLTPFDGGGSIPETSHVSAADAQGNLVAATITHGGAFGSLFTVPDYGLILGHGMCRFDPRPGRPNSVAAGKRPLNNVMTMVLRAPGRDIALGMPGGRRIISVGPQMVSRLIDHSATGAQAATAPRLHVPGAEPVELQDTVDQAIADALAGLGHAVDRVPRVGGHAAAAEVSTGAADGRRVRAGGGGFAVAVGGEAATASDTTRPGEPS